MIAVTNIYEVSISVVGHLQRLLHRNVTNVRYYKGCLSYEGECIAFCSLWVLSSSPVKMISSYYTTPFSDHIGPICKCLPSFVLVTQRQMREMGDRNRFCWPTSSFYFDQHGEWQFVLGNFLKTEILLQS